jgi:hypothetical protein
MIIDLLCRAQEARKNRKGVFRGQVKEKRAILLEVEEEVDLTLQENLDRVRAAEKNCELLRLNA